MSTFRLGSVFHKFENHKKYGSWKTNHGLAKKRNQRNLKTIIKNDEKH